MAQLGMATLSRRMSMHERNLQTLAEMLWACSRVRGVHCPLLPGDESHTRLAQFEMWGVGPLVSFELLGGKAHATKFIDTLSPLAIEQFRKGERITFPIHATHLGDCKTIATYPGDTTHSAVPEKRRGEVGCGDATIRMSPGIEPDFPEIAKNTIGLVNSTCP